MNLIKENSKKNLSVNCSFEIFDITNEKFPDYDLWICRDILYHFNFEDIFETLKNFINSNIKYILVTNTIVEKLHVNKDILTGNYRDLSLYHAPFNFDEEPLERILDTKHKEYNAEMCLWTKDQIKKAEGRLPDLLIACIGGGSNAMGLFYPFLNDTNVKMIGVEAAGEGLNKKHAASIAKGQLGVLHGSKSYILQDKDGQITETHSISAGLDYPGIGPEHAWLKDNKRVEYVSVTDNEALDAFKLCSQIEGIIPALEPSHALAYLIKKAPRMSKNNIIIMNMCGRGDKDIFTVAKKLKINI